MKKRLSGLLFLLLAALSVLTPATAYAHTPTSGEHAQHAVHTPKPIVAGDSCLRACGQRTLAESPAIIFRDTKRKKELQPQPKPLFAPNKSREIVTSLRYDSFTPEVKNIYEYTCAFLF